jgi:hypothetical protein
MFYFEQLLQLALDNIDRTSIMPAVLGIAETMVLLAVMVAAYQAAFGQGDLRVLGIASIQALILGVVFVNYGRAFRDVLAMHNSVADFIYNSSSVGDVFGSWMDSIAAYIKQSGNISLWSLVIGGEAAALSAIFIVLTIVIFAFSYVVFTLAYTLYGTALYVSGPLVLALMPIRGLGQLSRTYLINLFTFFGWGIIYAIFQVLISAINLGSAGQVFTNGGVLNVAKGASQMLLLALVSCLFAFAIGLIPFIASRVVRGDIGSTMMTMVSVVRTTVAAAAGMATAAIAGGGAGAAAARASSAGGSGAGTVGAGGPAATPVVARNSTTGTPSAPTPPPASSTARSYTASGQGSSTSSPQSSPVMYRGFSVTRAVAWHAGYQLGKALSSEGQNS